MPEKEELVRLRHMLDAARKAVLLAGAGSRDELDDPASPLPDALVRLVSVIGEAARKISDETCRQIDGVRWADLRGMRNRLIHEYFDVNLDILWATIEDDLPPLIEHLEAALPEPPDTESEEP